MALSDVTRIIGQLLPEPSAGLLAGILFGTKETLPREFSNDLVTTGTLHIVALSGMNIAIVSSLVSNSLLRFVSRRIASLLTVVVIIGYIGFVGPSPSVIRAGIMGTLVLLAAVWGRQSWSLFFLIFAGTVMLLVNSNWITDLSFQLSFLATLGIILFGNKKLPQKNSSRPRLEETQRPRLWELLMFFGRKTKGFIADDLRITLSAQVFTIPLIFFTFHRVSLISPLTNVLIGWTMPVITMLGFLVVGVGLVSQTLALPLSWVTWLFLEYVILVVQMTSHVPFSSIGGR